MRRIDLVDSLCCTFDLDSLVLCAKNFASNSRQSHGCLIDFYKLYKYYRPKVFVYKYINAFLKYIDFKNQSLIIIIYLNKYLNQRDTSCTFVSYHTLSNCQYHCNRQTQKSNSFHSICSCCLYIYIIVINVISLYN